MPRLPENYTRYPRPILWLLRGGELPGADGAAPLVVSSFYLSKLPLTNRQYEAFAPTHKRPVSSPGDDDPATGVTLEEARGYCAWYARVARKPIRLPSEEEWEYACRAGGAGEVPRSADSAVGLSRLKPNGVGLQSLLGGVWEWTDSGALRGGSFRTSHAELTATLRRVAEPRLRADDVGFRIARSL